jgi:adenylate cyclase
VRVRIAGDEAWLTIKGPARGLRRSEFEYAIAAADARQMLDTLAVGEPVEKTRYCLDYQGYLWELDVFEGRNAGLVVAEVELDDPAESPPLPPWLGREVTGDPRYLNARLAFEPFCQWGAAD